ncbi:TLC ATP/ADP transporter [Nitzschia inconspicua]|uniref:ADP,ATP carrier protein n=1 Tax=Nitzschia inconspicua TaxID=303405 RepID=A0A9K3KSR7_9STRA|nr:TLC ATP/ADP transporter [Nitzschia inconspicua]
MANELKVQGDVHAKIFTPRWQNQQQQQPTAAAIKDNDREKKQKVPMMDEIQRLMKKFKTHRSSNGGGGVVVAYSAATRTRTTTRKFFRQHSFDNNDTSKNTNNHQKNDNRHKIIKKKSLSSLSFPLSRHRGGGGGGGGDDDDDDMNNNNNVIINNDDNKKKMKQQRTLLPLLPPYSPRVKSCILMSLAMALHFGGYEFARSAALALFTSSTTGFSHPSAYPLAMGIVTPTSLLLLYGYGVLLKANGPRKALYRTTGLAVTILTVGTVLSRLSLSLLSSLSSTTTTTMSSSSINTIVIGWLSKMIVAMLFVFQNSYAHLIYTQQWSFLGSVMTPKEGTRWFSTIAGVSSLVCTVTATMVHTLSHQVGLFGLLLGTSFALFMSMTLADRAYQLAETNGFDPTLAKTNNNNNNNNHNQSQTKSSSSTSSSSSKSLLSKMGRMFRTSPTLTGLFGEVVSFQSLSTVLHVCFVRLLKETFPNDTARMAYTGRFYATINGCSAAMQFLVLPLARNYLEPKWVYRVLPLLILPLLIGLAVQPTSTTLSLAALAVLAVKAADYSVRNVANEMVYQPLDFDARYLGKEVIGVFANRCGKSGMSLILSGLTFFLPHNWMGPRQLSQLAVLMGGIWSSCSIWLSNHVVTNQEAETTVEQRNQQQSQQEEETKSSSSTPTDTDNNNNNNNSKKLQ